MDTTDSILMLGAYGWAFVKPIRKLYYNMNITLVSVLVALVIGTVELLSILTDKLGLEGKRMGLGGQARFRADRLSDHRHLVVSWLGSTLIYQPEEVRYDRSDRAGCINAKGASLCTSHRVPAVPEQRDRGVDHRTRAEDRARVGSRRWSERPW